MAHHSTDITTKCGRKVRFKKSSKTVTGFAGVLMLKDALKKSTFVQNICSVVNYWFPRDSIFYAYRTRDLMMMRVVRLACGMPDFNDGVQFKEDAAVRHAFGRCPSASTDSRFYNRIGGTCTEARDERVKGDPKDLPKGDPDRIGSLFMNQLNMLLLKEPDRLQVFCHRRHPATREPYHLTQDFREERAAVLRAVADGAVIVTPGISPGEADIMWAVLRGGGAVINLQKDEIPLSDKWHPSNERRLYCSLGRLLVLSVRDLPRHTFRDRHGDIIPAGSTYARFHLLNLVAEELCSEGIEHQCVVVTH